MCGSSISRDKPSSRGFSAAAVTTLQLRRAAHKMAHAVSGGGSGSSGATGTADIDMLEKQELTVGGAGGEGSAAPEGYITTLDKDGNIKEVNGAPLMISKAGFF